MIQDNFPPGVNWSAYVEHMAPALRLPIPPESLLEVVANLERTEAIAQLFLDFPLPTEIEIATTFEP